MESIFGIKKRDVPVEVWLVINQLYTSTEEYRDKYISLKIKHERQASLMTEATLPEKCSHKFTPWKSGLIGIQYRVCGVCGLREDRHF